jgi:hypothetical protein
MKPLSDRLSTVAGRIRRVRVRAVHAASSLDNSAADAIVDLAVRGMARCD